MGNACISQKQHLPFEPDPALGGTDSLPPTPSTAQPLLGARGTQNVLIDFSDPATETRNTTHRESSNLRPSAIDTQASSSGTAGEAEIGDSTASQNMPAKPFQSVPSGQRPTAAEASPPAGLPRNYRANRRGSVSAEVASLAASAVSQPQKPRKSYATEQVVLKAMTHSFLFSDLEEEQKIECIASMFKKEAHPGDVLIRQGEEGDNFYVIAEGTFTAHIAQSDGEERLAYTYEGKGAFGELALMYNCPRAATVKAETEGVLWAMDRSTFRRIILASRMAQRERFENALAQMKVFGSLTAAQRASIADCLALLIFEDAEVILKEGEELTAESKFYIVEDGAVACYRTVAGEQKFVKQIDRGGFFGEVALVTKSSTRAATCIAKGRCKLLALGRDAFERLMGPAEEILKKEISEYVRLNLDLTRQAGGSAGTNTAAAAAALPPPAAEEAQGSRPSGLGAKLARQASMMITGKRAPKSSESGIDISTEAQRASETLRYSLV